MFIDVDQEKYDSLDTMRSYAAADELLYSLKAETGLVWKLCELGKQPKKLVYAFSERIPRGRKIQEDLMNSRIWYNFGLPDWREIEKLVCESIDDRDDENNSLVEQINQYLINHVVPNRVIDPTKDICWLPVIQSFSKHVSAAGRSTEKWDEEQWHSNFRSALNNYIQTKLRDSIQNRYAFSIEYWYQTWEDKDSKEKNRSECRLMLFLYAIVYDSIQQQDNPLLTKNRTNKQQSPADAYVIPKADYQAFGNVLADHYQYCRGGTYKDADAPKRIHEELLKREPNERDFIKSIYDPGDLQLIPEKLEQATLGNDYKISMRQIIEFLEQPEENKVKTIKEKEKGIAAQIRKTIRLIRTHCEENSRKIEEYISRITSEYNRVKDEQLEKMPFTVEDCPDFTESGKSFLG